MATDEKPLPPARVRVRQPQPAHYWAFREKGLLWLKATAAYEKLDHPIMDDAEWDTLTKELWESYDKLDPYLKNAIPEACLSASTGSGIDWTKGLPMHALEDARKEVAK